MKGTLNVAQVDIKHVTTALKLGHDDRRGRLVSSHVHARVMGEREQHVIFKLRPVANVHIVSGETGMEIHSGVGSGKCVVDRRRGIVCCANAARHEGHLRDQNVELKLRVLPLPRSDSTLSSGVVLRRPYDASE